MVDRQFSLPDKRLEAGEIVDNQVSDDYMQNYLFWLEERFLNYAPLEYIGLFEDLYTLSNQLIDFRSFKDRIVEVRRVGKETSSGTKSSYRATAVTGNGNGIIGLGIGKANTVRDAVRRAIIAA